MVGVTYVLSLFPPANIFDMSIWCFSGFVGLFPLVIAAIYWRRLTAIAAHSSIVVTITLWLFMFIQSDFGHNRYSFPKEPIKVGDFTLIPPMMPVVTIWGTNSDCDRSPIG